jgi:hypothetical protein
LKSNKNAVALIIFTRVVELDGYTAEHKPRNAWNLLLAMQNTLDKYL